MTTEPGPLGSVTVGDAHAEGQQKDSGPVAGPVDTKQAPAELASAGQQPATGAGVTEKAGHRITLVTKVFRGGKARPLLIIEGCPTYEEVARISGLKAFWTACTVTHD